VALQQPLWRFCFLFCQVYFRGVTQKVLRQTTKQTKVVMQILIALQFKLPAAKSIRIPAGKAQGFTPLRPPMAAAIFGYEKKDGFEDSARSSCP